MFCGNGAGRADLEQACAGLNNVMFLDLQPFERLGELLGLADIHLLPQRADAADLVMPSKLTGMLASGKSVIATATVDTELGHVIIHDAKCGLIVEPENGAALAHTIIELSQDEQGRKVYGQNGRYYAEHNLSKSQILKSFEKELFDLIGVE